MVLELRKKVLIIEDDVDLGFLYKKAFTAMGHIPIVCKNGLEGLIKAVEEKPDIILLDINMPELDGFEVLKSLKEQTSLRPPVVVCSNSSEDNLEEKVLSLGAKWFFPKSDHTPEDVASKTMAAYELEQN